MPAGKNFQMPFVDQRPVCRRDTCEDRAVIYYHFKFYCAACALHAMKQWSEK
jgi:hypothetical protein